MMLSPEESLESRKNRPYVARVPILRFGHPFSSPSESRESHHHHRLLQR